MLLFCAEPHEAAKQTHEPNEDMNAQVSKSASKQQKAHQHAERAEAGPDVHVDKEAGIVSISHIPPGSR